MNKPADLQQLPSVPLWINGKPCDASSQRASEITNPATGKVTKTILFVTPPISMRRCTRQPRRFRPGAMRRCCAARAC